MADFIMKLMMGFLIIWIIFGVSAASISLIDLIYKHPIAEDKANFLCKQMGFDQHKSFSRVGIWSIDPLAIKCEYAERYTDLGVRT